MQSNCIKNLLDLKDVFIKSVKNFNNSVEIYAELPIFEQICPCCGSKTSKIHDHYIQPIKDSPIYFKPTTVFLKKTRYECKNCSKIFYPDNTFVGKYKRKSKRLIGYIIEQLRNNISASYIAKSINIIETTIPVVFAILSVTKVSIPLLYNSQ